MGARSGVKLRPTVEREILYRIVMGLRKDGLSYNQIIKEIEIHHGVTLSKSNISEWVNGKHKPFGSVRVLDTTPRPELSYVIGVRMGDASMSVNKNHNYMIKLRVIDKEFAEEFARCLSVILQRNPPRVKWHEKTHAWHTELSSLLLQNLLNQPLKLLRPIIQHCELCASAFLRGFFDSEGWVYRLVLGVVNTNMITLEYVLWLLEHKFHLRVYGPSLQSRRGRTVTIKGKVYHANKDRYALIVHKASLVSYRSLIGFTILRKRERLDSAVAQLTQ